MTSNTDLASLAGSITVQADMAATLKRTGLVRGKNGWQEGTCMLAANRAAIGIFSGAANCSQVSRRALTLR